MAAGACQPADKRPERVRVVRASSVRLLASGQVTYEGVAEDGPNATITSRSINAPRAVRARGQDRLHGPIRVLNGLGAIGMRDDLRLAARRAIRVLDGVGRSAAADGCGVGRGLPLRHAGGQLDEVVLLAVGVPLRNPARGHVRRPEGWAAAAR